MKTVFFGAANSIIKWAAYTDVLNAPNIEYCEYDISKQSLKRKYIFSSKFEKLVPDFIKKKVFCKYLNCNFLKTCKKDEQILFIFTCQYGIFFYKFFEYFVNFLKRRYKNGKFVFYYNDIIETCMPENLNFVKSKFDYVATFDKNEAEKYGLEYYGGVCSKRQITNEYKTYPSDVFFVGTDRGRLKKIITLFKKIADLNLAAVFYISEVNDEGKRYIENTLTDIKQEEERLVYKSSFLVLNEYVLYPRTLEFINRCKCMVEITIKNQTASTLRMMESVVYGKKLITTCNAKEQPYYKPQNMFVFKDIDNVSSEEISEFMQTPTEKVDYDFSPLKMVEYAKEKLFGEVK